jgi:hypothetical protein
MRSINKMARVGTLVVVTSFVVFCNTVSGQHDPIRPKLSESFSAEVSVYVATLSFLKQFNILYISWMMQQYTRSGLGTELKGNSDD